MADFAIEIANQKSERRKLDQLGMNEVTVYENNLFPQSFWELNPGVKKFRMSYSIERIELKDIPRTHCSWWIVSETTLFIRVFPTASRKPYWYMALN